MIFIPRKFISNLHNNCRQHLPRIVVGRQQIVFTQQNVFYLHYASIERVVPRPFASFVRRPRGGALLRSRRSDAGRRSRGRW